jgi:hypothetical protein
MIKYKHEHPDIKKVLNKKINYKTKSAQTMS